MVSAGEPFALGVSMAMVVVIAALVGTGVWVAVRLEGHMDTPATVARKTEDRRSGGPPAARRTGTGHVCTGHVCTGQICTGHFAAGRNVRCRCRDKPAHPRAGVR
jgi:hypothetical protein